MGLIEPITGDQIPVQSTVEEKLASLEAALSAVSENEQQAVLSTECAAVAELESFRSRIDAVVGATDNARVAEVRAAPDAEITTEWGVGAVGRGHVHRSTGTTWEEAGRPPITDEWVVIERPCPRVVQAVESSVRAGHRVVSRQIYAGPDDFVGEQQQIVEAL